MSPISVEKSRYIQRIFVHGLFDRLTYDIAIPASKESSTDLAILYGDNGCGKTTLLRLVHRLLSPEPASGHRTFVSNTYFRLLRIEFNDGLIIQVTRSSKQRRGYTVLVVDDQQELVYNLTYEDADKSIRNEADAFCSFLATINPSISMLTADRLTSTKFDKRERIFKRNASGSFEAVANPQDLKQSSVVEEALKEATGWAQRAIIESLNEGQVSTERIYLDVARRLISYGAGEGVSPGLHDLNSFRLSMQDVRKRLSEASDFGLVPSTMAIKTVEMALEAPDSKLPALSSVLSPFIESLSARLDALSQIETVIATFVASLSDFFVEKRVVFERKRGFGVRLDYAEHEFPAHLLSSGEQQLLLLFCMVLRSRETRGIIIVDEPEISLNAQWQRKLVDALIGCASGANIQFILATHSTAILSQHRECAIEMRIERGRELFEKLSQNDRSIFN